MGDRTLLCLAGVALYATAVGCGGGAQLVGDVFHDSEATYRIGDLGPGWQRLDVKDNDLAWNNSQLGAIVQVNASCDPYQDVPLTALTNHLLIGFTDRDWLSQQVVPFDQREALRSRLVAKLDGVPRELLFYVLKKNGCVYDFALIAPQGADYQAAEPLFERFVGGFTTDVSAP